MFSELKLQLRLFERHTYKKKIQAKWQQLTPFQAFVANNKQSVFLFELLKICSK